MLGFPEMFLCQKSSKLGSDDLVSRVSRLISDADMPFKPRFDSAAFFEFISSLVYHSFVDVQPSPQSGLMLQSCGYNRRMS